MFAYDPKLLLNSFLTIAFHFFLPVGARLVTKCNQGVGFIYFWIIVINLETQSCLLFNLTYTIFLTNCYLIYLYNCYFGLIYLSMLPDNHVEMGAGHIYNDVVHASHDVLARHTPYRPRMSDYT